MELISMFPRSAAEYVYVKQSLGNRLGAFVVGWIEIIADVVAASTVAIRFAGYFVDLFGGYLVVVAITLIAMLSVVNSGVRNFSGALSLITAKSMRRYSLVRSNL